MAASGTAFTPTLATFDSGWEGTPEPWSMLREWYRQLPALAHREGVVLLAGTDVARKTGPIQPGLGLHQELEDLVEIGLTPGQALRAATLHPAIVLGRRAEYGGIEPGKVADLVLLEGNPLEDIKQTREIAAVVLRGRLLDAESLSDLRDSSDLEP